ncbi:O-antigen ligase family protein [Neobacillus sp. 3P2-tot-E-2]|uniref:O-antigen ligase family protein n=1 Tax=Neobacillus sp. 3P2-tot-E-2 TaxID=3132212 RepID=UPI0039A1EE32
MAVNYNQKNTNFLFTVAIGLMAILLHQSQVIFGVNLSLADIFCCFILMVLVFSNQVEIPITAFCFFIVVSIVVILSSVFFVPAKFMYNPNFLALFSEYAKLLAIFTYFIIGYNLSRINLIEKTVKWFSNFGIFIGGVGIVFTVFNIHALSDILFYADTRYRGLMIDPNYFSVLQVAALVYISRVHTSKIGYKYLAYLIIIMSVLTSGSKTGIITLFSYLGLRIVEYLFIQNKKANAVILQLFLIVLVLIVVPLISTVFLSIVNFLGSSIPSFDRVQVLFSDFSSAISENGSGRNITWRVALQVISLSPVIGIGIGTYSTVANQMFHSNDISHNTFLQLSAEWGIPLAAMLFSYIFLLLGKATFSRIPNKSGFNLILRDIIIILLIGSMAISLNNARILWLTLGALTFSLIRRKIPGKKEVNDDWQTSQLHKEEKGDYY